MSDKTDLLRELREKLTGIHDVLAGLVYHGMLQTKYLERITTAIEWQCKCKEETREVVIGTQPPGTSDNFNGGPTT